MRCRSSRPARRRTAAACTRRRRAEQRHQRHADRGGGVHQPGIVADRRPKRATAGRSPCRGRCARSDRAAGAPIRRRPAAPHSAASLSFGEPTSHTCMPIARGTSPRARRNASAASASPGRTRRRGTGSRRAGRCASAAARSRPRDSRRRARAPALAASARARAGLPASAAKRSTRRGIAFLSRRRASVSRPQRASPT